MDWQQLDRSIDSLNSLLYGKPNVWPTNWKLVWDTARDIQEGFRGVRYPTRKERDEAWQRFNALRDEARRRSDESRAERERVSGQWKNEILRLVHSAEPNDLFGFDPINVEDMKAYGRRLKEAGDLLSRHKGEMLADDKAECFDAIVEMRKIHNLWWAELHKHRSAKQEERRQRALDNLEKNRERYRKTAEALDRAKDYVERLRTDIASAWNDDWASRAEDRLADAENRIDDMERSLREIERWIEEDEDRLR